MDYLLLISVLISFSLAVAILPLWIRKCRTIGLVWKDMHKVGHPINVAASGGVVVVMAFVLGVLSYVALKTFLWAGTIRAVEIFALLSMVLIFGIIGLTDDLIGWKSKGLPMKIRLFLAAVASIPLVVINAGTHTMSIPFIGAVNFGILYPLVLIPLGIVGVSTTYNFLAGFNGLESGQGILILGFLSYVAYVTGNPWLSIIGFCMVASLIGFYYFNKVPAQVFPGDIMTYSIGALIIGMAILGNFEKIAFIVFIPYIIEVILKLRGRLRVQSFGIVDKSGYLSLPRERIYGLEHLAIFVLNKFGRATERKVTYLIHAFQILFILVALSIM